MPKHKSHSKESKRSSSSSTPAATGTEYEYPGLWCEWEWEVDKKRWMRYRLKSPDDYEYEYDPPESSSQSSADPRHVTQLEPINELQAASSGQYQTSNNYVTSTSATEQLTRNFQGLKTTSTPTPVTFTRQITDTVVQPSSPTHIRTRNPYVTEEEFDPLTDYKVHDAWQFKWGRVFKVLWTEPRGAGGGNDSDTGTLTRGKGETNAEEFRKVRRFIIINPMDGHCICLPINTYTRQGVTKKGVHAKHHTIAYSDKKPVYIRGEREKGLTKTPIRISCPTRHKLDERSRLNYAKTYTVEYNVKVWFIGKVHEDSEWTLSTDYNRVHPLLQPRGVPPEEQTNTAVPHAGGGSYNTAVYQPQLQPTTTSWTPVISTQSFTQGTDWGDARPSSSLSTGSGGGNGSWSSVQDLKQRGEGAENSEEHHPEIRENADYAEEGSVYETASQGDVTNESPDDDLYSAD
ncbi:hypothetical protein BKA64DRAFT_636196 [Cadophora sp. MPI-SDFR-AT-0126]|nr:hypothetical protein BKA64DRAFT_636196 [Leotiomycetes sp. MPI-SDFR-AT-0126]